MAGRPTAQTFGTPFAWRAEPGRQRYTCQLWSTVTLSIDNRDAQGEHRAGWYYVGPGAGPEGKWVGDSPATAAKLASNAFGQWIAQAAPA